MQDHAPDEADQKTAWAEARTDWAEDRTVLANERTFAGWMRTGMACIALAVGLKAIFGEVEGGFYVVRLTATLFCGIAVYVFWAARAKACTTVARLNAHQANPIPTRSITWVAALLALGALATGGLLWFV